MLDDEEELPPPHIVIAFEIHGFSTIPTSSPSTVRCFRDKVTSLHFGWLKSSTFDFFNEKAVGGMDEEIENSIGLDIGGAP